MHDTEVTPSHTSLPLPRRNNKHNIETAALQCFKSCHLDRVSLLELSLLAPEGVVRKHVSVETRSYPLEATASLSL